MDNLTIIDSGHGLHPFGAPARSHGSVREERRGGCEGASGNYHEVLREWGRWPSWGAACVSHRSQAEMTTLAETLASKVTAIERMTPETRREQALAVRDCLLAMFHAAVR
jgi:hypothetical protein